MWWGRSDPPAHAWLGRTRVAWREAAGAAIQHAAVDGIAQGIETLSELGKRQRGADMRTVRVSLDGDLCSLRLVPAIEGVNGRDEADAAVVAFLREAEGRASDIAARVAEWPPSGPRWLVAVVAEGALNRLAQSLGPRLRSVRPWWWWAVPWAGGRVALWDGLTLTYCDFEHADSCGDAGSVSPMADAAAAQRWLQRRRVADGGSPRDMFVFSWGGAPPVAETTPAASSAGEAEGFGFGEWLHRVA